MGGSQRRVAAASRTGDVVTLPNPQENYDIEVTSMRNVR
jgi:hypothetical protein